MENLRECELQGCGKGIYRSEMCRFSALYGNELLVKVFGNLDHCEL